MRLSRIFKALCFVLSGGIMLQATTGGCQEVLAPIVSDIVSSLIINILTSGLTGLAT